MPNAFYHMHAHLPPHVQRDREQLINTVSYTKGQASSIVTMVQGVTSHVSHMQSAPSMVSGV